VGLEPRSPRASDTALSASSRRPSSGWLRPTSRFRSAPHSSRWSSQGRRRSWRRPDAPPATGP